VFYPEPDFAGGEGVRRTKGFLRSPLSEVVTFNYLEKAAH
jgi:hypothetical protein